MPFQVESYPVVAAWWTGTTIALVAGGVVAAIIVLYLIVRYLIPRMRGR